MTTLATEYDQCALDPPYELEDYSHELRTALADFTGPRFDFDGTTVGVATVTPEPEDQS